jgi:c-di-GMP-binding flagellar brake protein YcgR
VGVNGRLPAAERRRFPRLPLAIPVFVRSGAETDKEFLEFATALNVSAGGMLVAVRRSIPSTAQILLEIPSAPLAALAALPHVTRSLRARVLRMQHGEGYNLVGLKFSRPLVSSDKVSSNKASSGKVSSDHPPKSLRRKVTSSM